LSRDGVPVVIHDVALERTTLGTGLVSDFTALELARTKLRDREDEGVPTLDQVLQHVAESKVQLAVELKTAADTVPYPDIERLVLDTLNRHGLLDRSIIVSFVPAVLERVRELEPRATVMACVWRPQTEMLGGLRAAIARWSAIDRCILAVKEEFLSQNEALCRSLIDAQRLAVGLSNDPERMAYWLGQPVRHISTDRPDIAIGLRDKLQRPAREFATH
jgi:glycerophosphoryl diester phosphodiesterase